LEIGGHDGDGATVRKRDQSRGGGEINAEVRMSVENRRFGENGG